MKELQFTNRVEILNKIDKNIKSYLNDDIFFYTICIYGMGGIGKSRLLEEIKKIYKQDNKLKIYEISFEIMNKENELYSLIRIRKLFGDINCLLFDYALRVFNEKFTLLSPISLQENPVNMKDLWGNIVSSFFPEYDAFKSCIDIFRLISKKYQYLSESNEYIEEINNTKERECLDKLREYLIIDIKNNMKDKYLFLVDAYNLYDTLNEGVWLRNFILELRTGIILIAGRESLEWENFFNIGEYEELQLKRFPKSDAENLLRTFLPEEDIQQAVKLTECIPFYVNIVTQLYSENHKIDWNKIKTKENIIVKFMNHFDKDVQRYVRIMCEIRIFDNKISEYMLREERLNISREKARYIYTVNMANFCTKDYSLYKFHDILVLNNHQSFRKHEIPYILCTYFNGINQFLPTYNEEECKILFDNILYLLKNNNDDIKEQCVEIALDVLFNIIDRGSQVNIEINESQESYFSDILLLLKSFWFKKRSTILCKKTLDKIHNPKRFKRHEKSFYVLFTLSKSLLYGYSQYQQELIELNKDLKKEEASYWYYGRIKNYLGESFMLQSNIRESVKLLLGHLATLEENNNDHYQTLRHLGHNYRFSFQLNIALNYYKKCENMYKSNTALMDIYTNLAETYCFIDSDKCLYYCDKAIEKSKGLDRKKALAKVFYSKAIAISIKNKNFDKAYEYINQSEYLNKLDGYQAGLIFTYMAKAIIEFLDIGAPNKKTIKAIHNLTEELDVYKFFCYYIERLANNPKSDNLFEKYTWILPDTTKSNFESFIDRLESL